MPLLLILMTVGAAAKPAPLSPKDLFARVSPGVGVVIIGNSLGSCVAISKHRVVTNWHVVREEMDDELPQVRLGKSSMRAVVVAIDVEQDLAMLQLVSGTTDFVPARRATLPAVGEVVFTIGAPQGLDKTFANGMVSSIRELESRTLIQTNAAISQGSSEQGRLIGITVSMLAEGQQLNFAIPTAAVERLNGNLFSRPEVARHVALLPEESRETFEQRLSKGEMEQFAKMIDALKGGAEVSRRVTDALAELRKDTSSSKARAIELLRDAVLAAPLSVETHAGLVTALTLQLDDLQQRARRLDKRAEKFNLRITRYKQEESPKWETNASELAAQVAAIKEEYDPLVERARVVETNLRHSYKSMQSVASQADELSRPDELALIRAQGMYHAYAGTDEALKLSKRYQAKAEGRSDGWSDLIDAEYAANVPSSPELIEGALKQLAALRTREPGYLRAHVLSARLNLQVQDYERARTELEAALKLQPKHDVANELLAWTERESREALEQAPAPGDLKRPAPVEANPNLLKSADGYTYYRPSPASGGQSKQAAPAAQQGGTALPTDWAPVPSREDGRIYVRLFMSAACVADVEPGALKARTGDLLLLPFEARAIQVKSSCGGLAELYFGREARPRVSENFRSNVPLKFEFKRQ